MMSERKNSAGFVRKAATPSPDGVAPFMGSTADPGTPAARGLYDPANDKDACGVGFIADIKGRKSHKIVEDGLRILCNLEHRGATGADPRMGDGAGILVQIPHKFFVKEAAKLGIHLAGARRIRRRPAVHAAGNQLAADHPRHLCRRDRA